MMIQIFDVIVHSSRFLQLLYAFWMYSFQNLFCLGSIYSGEIDERPVENLKVRNEQKKSQV